MQPLQAGSPYPASNSQERLDRFLVCGLGSLGQHCILALKEFGISVSAIDLVKPQTWDIPNIPELLDELIVGDCRQPEILEKAKVRQCRAVLLVTSSENVNAETAFASRLLNSQARLVVRSAKDNLNQLLNTHLGNLVAFEPTQLPAAAFALAALGTETAGLFKLEGQWLQIVKNQLTQNHRWSNQRLLCEINNPTRRVVNHAIGSSALPQQFHQWNLDTRVQAGDTIVYIEAIDMFASIIQKPATEAQQHKGKFLAGMQGRSWQNLRQKWAEFWQSTHENRLWRISIVIVLTLLWGIGVYLHELGWPKALFATLLLLFGGFSNLFEGVNLNIQPESLFWYSLPIVAVGTASVGVVYAIFTERLLSARFQLVKRRPPVPQQDHVVIVGLGRVGQRVAGILQEFKQPLVGLSNNQLDSSILPQIPLIVGNFTDSLKKANIATAKSVVAVTDDEMTNLEIGLMAHEANDKSNSIIRTYQQRLSDNLSQLLPYAQVLCAYALSAEAFAGAAFGEKILNLFRLNNQTILVTEYNVEPNDNLDNLLLAEVAYGYGVVPILYQKVQEKPKLMPSDDTKLAGGDRLVVLATINSLRRIERGGLSMAPKSWRVSIERAFNEDAMFEGANVIARISGCSLSVARDLMSHLPKTLRSPLYQHQAQRLVRELSKVRVQAHIVIHE